MFVSQRLGSRSIPADKSKIAVAIANEAHLLMVGTLAARDVVNKGKATSQIRTPDCHVCGARAESSPGIHLECDRRSDRRNG